jgi:hypothetical protein
MQANFSPGTVPRLQHVGACRFWPIVIVGFVSMPAFGIPQQKDWSHK